jgi:cytoskeletal protein CcmA (bactofilin family)
MFRKKDPDPLARTGSDRPAEPIGLRGPLETRTVPPAPEFAPRRVDPPTTGFAAPERALAGGATLVQDAAGKRLIVGQGISLSGEITACDRLVVEGSVQVTLNQTRAIEITESGRFTQGKAEVEEAEISGLYEGELTVRRRLLIRSRGQVKGTVRYGELEVERGGRLAGSISMIEPGAEPTHHQAAAPTGPAFAAPPRPPSSAQDS